MIEGYINKTDVPGKSQRLDFKERYTIVDNLDLKTEPRTSGDYEIYNTKYTFNIVVMRGTLHLTVNKQEVELKSNEMLIVRPFIRFKLHESTAIFFVIVVKNELCNEIYEHCTVSRDVQIRSFCFHHYRFNQDIIDILLNDYLTLKEEMKLDDYKMKELALRSIFSVFVSHLYSFRVPQFEIPYPIRNHQEQIYNKFLNQLSLYYRKERSVRFYAEKLNVAPKYLSTVVRHFTEYSASTVIDLYVVYRIKQALYVNEHNIKSISATYNFPNQSFFGRYFKRVAGMSPNEYIKQNNRKAIAHSNR